MALRSISRWSWAATLAVSVVLLSGCWRQTMEPEPPVAVIYLEPASGAPPLTVVCDGSGSTSGAEIVSWRWDFGDGATAEGTVVTHTYTEEGTYTVSLTVEDALGRTDTSYATVEVARRAPVASFGMLGRESGTGPVFKDSEPITFDALSSYDPDGVIVAWMWDFGDGDTATGPVVTHAYELPTCTTEPRTFVVTLTVVDNDGLMGVATAEVTIVCEIAGGGCP